MINKMSKEASSNQNPRAYGSGGGYYEVWVYPYSLSVLGAYVPNKGRYTFGSTSLLRKSRWTA